MSDRPLWYTLDGDNNPVPLPNTPEGAAAFGDCEQHRVGDDTVSGVRVSTVFLGIDHSFREGRPILWETMVFLEPDEDGRTVPDGDPRRLADQLQWRYASRAEAAEGHARVLRMVREGRYQELAEE